MSGGLGTSEDKANSDVTFSGQRGGGGGATGISVVLASKA